MGSKYSQFLHAGGTQNQLACSLANFVARSFDGLNQPIIPVSSSKPKSSRVIFWICLWVCRNKKRARRRVFTDLLAEWTGLIVNQEKPRNPTIYKGYRQQHVVKTCGKVEKYAELLSTT